MKSQFKYYFKYIERCNMCGSTTNTHQILGKRLNGTQGLKPRKKIGITTTVCKCSDCGLIYSNPQPLPFDLNEHYGIPPEEYWVESYFEVNNTYFLGEIKRLKSLMNFSEGMKSLDIGAGIGKAMLVLEKHGFDAYGFEPSKAFYDCAISKMGISTSKLQLGQIETIDYPEETFDFISFGVVLEHLYSPSEAITKAMRWLKPNGVIHIEVPSSNWLMSKLINFFYKLNFSDYVGNISPMHSPFHLYEFSLNSFLAHAKANSYEVAFHEHYVCKTYMPKIADYVLKPYMKWTHTGMQLCVWLRKK